MDSATLFLLGIIAVVFFFLGKLVATLRFKQREPAVREDAIKRSRAVLGGQFSEQLAPYLPDFPYTPTEVKFLGKPVDFIVFKGLEEKKIEQVVFVEVKSGNAQMNSVEKTLKEAIERNNVTFATYRVPHEVTRGKA